MITGAPPPARSAICTLVAIVLITPFAQPSFAASAMPPVGDTHFCPWWQAKIRPPSAVTEPSAGAADSRQQKPASPELRASFDQLATPDLTDPDGVRGLDAAVVTAAIGCLLQLEADVRPTRSIGLMWMGAWLRLDTVPTNLQALYYISYLYTRNWKHGTTIALCGPGAQSFRSRPNYATTQSSIHEAFRSYRHWYEQVKAIGLAEARAERLDPLAGTSLYWY